MSRSKVIFELGQEGLGQAALSQDGVSGIVWYGTAPGSFATNPMQAVYSVQDAEDKGITNDYSDETKVRAIFTISGTLAEGDTVTLSVNEKNPVTPDNPTGATTVVLGTGTAPATPTATTYADALVADINANTYRHQYTATNTAGAITLIGRPGLGINLNPAVQSTPLSETHTGAGTYTITQQFGTGSGGATAGVYSKKALWHYHITRFFDMNPEGVLWVGFFASVSSTFADVVTLQNAADGAIKQIAVYDITATSASAVLTNSTVLQARGEDLAGLYSWAGSILYAPNIKAISNASSLLNQQTLSDYYVTTEIEQDGGAAGAQLFINSGVSVTDVGGTLGVESAASVNQNIGEIQSFNKAAVLTGGTTTTPEMGIPALSNGQKISALSSSLLDQLDAYRYLFATTITGRAGTYINNDWTNIVQTSPYYRISRNRVMAKAQRLVYLAVVPLLKSQIVLNADGTISDQSIAGFTGQVAPVGAQMKEAGEISGMKVTMSNTQNVLSTGNVEISVAIQPTVSADFITVKMSFKAKL